jgi:hypothetical protein
MNAGEQSSFAGWAILEIFGHQKYAGFVETEYYGTACMFRCDVPALPERERVTRSGCYVRRELGELVDQNFYAPPGSTVKEPATIAYTKCFGVGALFSMTPCDEAAARRAVEELQPRALMLVSLPAEKAIAAGAEPISRDFTCCGGNPEAGHAPDCDLLGSDMCADCGESLELCSCQDEDDAR